METEGTVKTQTKKERLDELRLHKKEHKKFLNSKEGKAWKPYTTRFQTGGQRPTKDKVFYTLFEYGKPAGSVWFPVFRPLNIDEILRRC